MSKRVPTRHRVLPVFEERWSPRSFAARAPEAALLASMFEAARLAPSAHNTQPARFVLVRKERPDEFRRLWECLSEANRVWAGGAPVLVLACAMGQRFSATGGRLVPYPHALHDLGLAVMSFILQGQAQDLYCHPMAGFDPDQAREALRVPPPYEPAVVLAVGYLGEPGALPEALRERERAPRTRRPLEETVFEGIFGSPSPLLLEALPCPRT